MTALTREELKRPYCVDEVAWQRIVETVDERDALRLERDEHKRVRHSYYEKFGTRVRELEAEAARWRDKYENCARDMGGAPLLRDVIAERDTALSQVAQLREAFVRLADAFIEDETLHETNDACEDVCGEDHDDCQCELPNLINKTLSATAETSRAWLAEHDAAVRAQAIEEAAVECDAHAMLWMGQTRELLRVQGQRIRALSQPAGRGAA